MKQAELDKILRKIAEDYKDKGDMEDYRRNFKPPSQTHEGLPGWICPNCGRGLAPHTSSCPCVPMPLNQFIVTCGGSNIF